MKKKRLKLHTKIFIGLIAGVIFGILANRWGFSQFTITYIKPVGDMFIRLITMIVVPLVFVSLVIGTAHMHDLRKLSRIGGKTIAFYMTTTVIAITLGVILANGFGPGKGLSKDTKENLQASQAKDAPAASTENLQPPSFIDTFLDIIPRNPIRAFTEGKMLQIIFFAMMFGVALTMISPQRCNAVVEVFSGINDAMIRIVHIVMKLAPYGVFALIAAIISQHGLAILVTLFKFALVTLGGLTLHTLVVFPVMLKLFTKVKVRNFFAGIRPAMLIAFSSSSSSATLPVTMECVEENIGVSNDIASFTLPLGSTINMDGTAMYQGIAAIFIAQVYGMNLDIHQQLAIILTATLASIGTAGVPGVGIIMLTMVLKQIGVPLDGIALILGVDRILDMCRTTVNVTGDACCAVVVASTEGEITHPPTTSDD